MSPNEGWQKMTNAINQLRTSDREEAVETIRELVDDVEGETADIDVPDRSDLHTEKIFLEREPEGNIGLNDEWVHPLYGRINNMMAENQSPIIIIVGKEGTGKSMTALVLCYYLHDKLNILRGDFDPRTQTIYTAIEFMLAERDSTRKALMFEEANETLNSNQYNSKMNKAVAGALRTQRKRENCHIFIGPEYKELDPRIREKGDIVIDLKFNQYASVRSYRLKHAKRSNRGMDYEWCDYPDWKVPDVPARLKEIYDEIDNEFKGGYLDELLLGALEERKEELEEQNVATL